MRRRSHQGLVGGQVEQPVANKVAAIGIQLSTAVTLRLHQRGTDLSGLGMLPMQRILGQRYGVPSLADLG